MWCVFCFSLLVSLSRPVEAHFQVALSDCLPGLEAAPVPSPHPAVRYPKVCQIDLLEFCFLLHHVCFSFLWNFQQLPVSSLVFRGPDNEVLPNSSSSGYKCYLPYSPHSPGSSVQASICHSSSSAGLFTSCSCHVAKRKPNSISLT